MRLLPSFLFLLLLSAPASAAGPLRPPADADDLLHLSVRSAGVRIRAGAGTSFAIVGTASRKDADACRFLASAIPGRDSSGKAWFRLVAGMPQDGSVLFPLAHEGWIRADFVRCRPLSEAEKALAERDLFHILDVPPHALTQVTPAKDAPLCTKEDDCLFSPDSPVPDAVLPAGEPCLLWSVRRGRNVCVPIWKAEGRERIRQIGAMPLEAFRAADFGDDDRLARRWLKKNGQLP